MSTQAITPLPTISCLGITLRTRHTPQLSRSDLVHWHFSGKTISLNLVPLLGAKQTYCKRGDNAVVDPLLTILFGRRVDPGKPLR